MDKTKSNLFELIQIGRGLAAIMVIFYHLTNIYQKLVPYKYASGIFLGGNIGVDFFFTLSGFIIFFAHNKDIGNPLKFKNYITKRFIRIFPFYWLFTFALIPIYFMFPAYGQAYMRDLKSILTSLFLIIQPKQPIIGVAWSLRFELLYYCLFSLLIIFKPKISFTVIGTWLAVSGIITINHLINGTTNINYLVDYFFSYYNFEFVIGCVIGYIILNFKPIKRPYFTLSIGVCIFVFFYILYVCSYIKYNIESIIFILPFALIIYSFAIINVKNKSKIFNIFVYFGDASYSIYLTHATLLSFITKVVVALRINVYVNNLLLLTVCALITIVLGCLIHGFIEKPIIRFCREKLLYSKAKSLNSIQTSAKETL